MMFWCGCTWMIRVIRRLRVHRGWKHTALVICSCTRLFSLWVTDILVSHLSLFNWVLSASRPMWVCTPAGAPVCANVYAYCFFILFAFLFPFPGTSISLSFHMHAFLWPSSCLHLRGLWSSRWSRTVRCTANSLAACETRSMRSRRSLTT